MNSSRRNTIFVLSVLILTSFLSLLFCSKNSFLYSFNDWVDGNAFFTMGKGMVNGLVPYKDLFEQKGPFLYLIYGFAYLLSHSTLHGVFIIEVLSMTFTTYYVYKLANNFTNKIYSLLVCILFIPIVCSSKSFVQGGSCEEFCLPFFSYSIYSFYNVLNKENTNKQYFYVFFTGLCAGFISLMKFNLLSFWFIWMVIIFVNFLFNKKIKMAFISCFVFLVGMFLPIIIFTIYFLMNNALTDFVDSYLLFNVKSYSTILTLKERIHNMLYACLDELNYNLDIKILTFIGFISILTTWICKNFWFILFVIISYIFLMFGVFFGGNAFFYYYLCFQIYIIFGLIGIFKIINIILVYVKFNKIAITMLGAVILCLTLQNILMSPNLEYVGIKKEYYAQYIFNEIISLSDDKTLLNYDNLDGGFYTTCDILPNVKYFMRQNVDYDRYPIIMDSQNEYIRDKKVNYVVIREYFGNRNYRKDLTELNENYNCIKHHSQIYEGMDYDYYLYERKE